MNGHRGLAFAAWALALIMALLTVLTVLLPREEASAGAADAVAVYEDAIAGPWIDISWGVSNDPHAAGEVRSGAAALASTGSGAIAFRRGQWGSALALDASAYASIRFAVHAQGRNAELAMAVGSDSGGWLAPVRVGVAAAGQWTEFDVPITDLARRGGRIDRFYIAHGGDSTTLLHYDDIVLVPRAAPLPAELPAGIGVPVYEDAVLSPWLDISWGVVNDPHAAGSSYSGTASLRSSGAGAVAFRHGPWGSGLDIDTGQYQSFRFAVHPGQRSVTLLVAAGNDALGWFSPVPVGFAPAGRWTVFEVSTARLNPTAHPIHKVYIGHGRAPGAVLRFDAIAFGADPPAAVPASAAAVPAGPALPPELDVFLDEVEGLWLDISWGVATDARAEEVTYEGSRSLRVRGAGAVAFRHGPWARGIAIDPRNYGSLSFAVHAGSNAVDVVVAGGNDVTGWFVPVRVGRVSAGGWTPFEVATTDLSPAGTPLHKLYIWHNGRPGTVLHVDAVRFTRSSPEPGAGQRGTPITVYDDALARPWLDISWGLRNSPDATERVREGARSLRSVGSGGLAFRHGPWDGGIPIQPAAYALLSLAVYPEGHSREFYVTAGSDLHGWFTPVSLGRAPGDAWTVLQIPARMLSPSGRVLHKLYIAHDGDGDSVVYVDDIRFGAGTTASPPPGGAAPRARPVVRDGGPVGVLATHEAVLAVTTDVAADCRYGRIAGQAYEQLAGRFATSDGLAHEASLTALEQGPQRWYVRCASTDSVASAEYLVAFEVDTRAPTVRAAQPPGVVRRNTVHLAVQTDEGANCRFADGPGTTYTQMAAFATTGDRAHRSPAIGPLADGVHERYVRCADAAGNESDAYRIAITIDTPAPLVTHTLPGRVLPQGTTATTVRVHTSEPASCRYGTDATERYAAMPGRFTESDGIAHAFTAAGLVADGEYVYYARCTDAAGNESEAHAIGFSIASLWVSGWYAGWFQNDLRPQDIDFEVVTHVLHFMITPRSDGTLNVSSRPGFESPGRIASVVNAVHAGGREVLVTVGGAGSYADFSNAIKPAAREAFVANLVAFVAGHGYDGIDVDMEPINAWDYANFQAFVLALRTALDAVDPTLMLTVAAGPAGAICPIHDQFDQINIMTYDMSGAFPGWVTWHNAPVKDGGEFFPPPSSWRRFPSADLWLQGFLNAGCPAFKLSIGVDFYGYEWKGGTGTDTGGVTRPRQSWLTPPSVRANVPYYDLARMYDLDAALWDPIAEAAYLSIDRPGSAHDVFVSFDNEQSARAKVRYARDRGLGGLGIWELAGGYRKHAPVGQRDPLLQAIKAALAASP